MCQKLQPLRLEIDSRHPTAREITMNSRGSENSLLVSDAQDADDQLMQDYEEEDREENGETSDSEGDDDGEDADGNVDTRTELEKFARASASGMETALEDYLGPAGEGGFGKKRERSNAKAVECLDMDGSLVELFRSGMAASMKLGIPQGDISLCCRGLKPSVSGYKFRFYGETEEKQALRLKKGFVLEGYGVDSNQAKPEMTRTTRASRGEYGQGVRQMDLQSRNILDPPQLKVLCWLFVQKFHCAALTVSFVHIVSKMAPRESEIRSFLNQQMDPQRSGPYTGAAEPPAQERNGGEAQQEQEAAHGQPPLHWLQRAEQVCIR